MLAGQLVDSNSSLPHLLHLTCVGCELASHSAAAIASRCPSLVQLQLERCRGFDAAAAVELHRLPRLVQLTLARCGCTDAGLAALAEMLPERVAIDAVDGLAARGRAGVERGGSQTGAAENPFAEV